ncbi:hypothetical protein MMC07_001345 [Pseudocyphellaria aurata]|nr:hypothetical protein [Pseudocyphellaria aurata]
MQELFYQDQTAGLRQEIENQKAAHENELKIAKNRMVEMDDMGRNLHEAQQSNNILKGALAEAQDEATFYENRMRHFNYILEQKPGQVDSTDAMIHAKDKMLSDLEARAGECWMASIQREKRTRRQHESAETEIARLKKQLTQSVAVIEKLTDSKQIFEQQSTDVLRMLRSRIQPTDFICAMDHHFSLVMQDNSFLLSRISEQTQELSGKDTENAALKAKVLEMTELLEAMEERRSVLETTVREQEDQAGALEIEMSALTSQNEEVNARNDSIIADLQRQLRAAYSFNYETRDEQDRELIRAKDSEILHFKETCENYAEKCRGLESDLQNREAAVNECRAEICYAHFREREKSTELAAAEEKITTLESQARGQLGLPSTLSIFEVLGQKQELDRTRRECRDLEDELQSSQANAERDRIVCDSVKVQSERWLFGMQNVGLELLTRRRRACGTRGHPRLMETDEELEFKLRNFWTAFN